MRAQTRGNRPARIISGLTEGWGDRNSIQCCFSYVILPFNLTRSFQRGGPGAGATKALPAPDFLCIIFHLDTPFTPFLFYYHFFYHFLTRYLGFGRHSAHPGRTGVAIHRILGVDCSSDAQMRRSTLSPHQPRLQQLAGSASLCSCATVDDAQIV